jgi:hypothetical protein
VLGVCKFISLHLKGANLLYRLSVDSTVRGYFVAKKRLILLIIIKLCTETNIVYLTKALQISISDFVGVFWVIGRESRCLVDLKP